MIAYDTDIPLVLPLCGRTRRGKLSSRRYQCRGNLSDKSFSDGRLRPLTPRSPALRGNGSHDALRRVTMSRTRYRIYESAYPHFLTCTVVGWLPVFTRPETVSIVFDSWRFLQKAGRLKLYGYVILENHLHLIASGEQLAKEIGDCKL